LKEINVKNPKPHIKNGQYNLPSWNRFSQMVDGIWDRKYYTNHGPLVQELEEKLALFFNVKHAIAMTNSHIAIMISAKAIDVKQEVIVPAFSDLLLSQSILWVGANPVFCDMKKHDPHIDTKQLHTKITSQTSGIFSTNLWGDFSQMGELIEISNNIGLKTLFFSGDSIGRICNDDVFTTYLNNSVNIFSFNELNILNAADGACVCTNNDDIAARIRNIRSSYGSGPPVDIPYTGNGRMSEIQAGLALLSLEDINHNIKKNKYNYKIYNDLIKDIPGIKIYSPSNKGPNFNYQNIILLVDESNFGTSTKKIIQCLNNIGIKCTDFSTYGINPNSPYNVISEMPNTNLFRKNTLRLPNNKMLNKTLINSIADILKELYSKNG